MSSKSMYIWVEGHYDERFALKILKPIFDKSGYISVSVHKYSKMAPKVVSNYIKSIKQNQDEFLFITDLDKLSCVTQKKDQVCLVFGAMRLERISVVIPEIEAWYIAGLSNNDRKTIGIRHMGNTDSLDKEKFNNIMLGSKFDSKDDFTIEILNKFRREEAVRNSKSFSRFIQKYCNV